MRHYSDEIINATLRESYLSQAAAGETDRQAAEKAYKTELTNGPKKIVTPANGKPFTIGVGSFDLENMHKAYDGYYVQNGLLDIFTDDGRLKDKATYGRIKTLNRNESAAKALYKLWGVQFGRDGMQFTSVKNARAKEKQDAQDRQAQRYANLDRFKAEIQPKLSAALIDLVKSNDAWKDFVAAYPESERDTLDLKCTNATY